MPSRVIHLEAHVLHTRTAWCSECFTAGALLVDCALVDPDSLRILSRFTVRADCPCEQT